jgi:DNA-binding MarR family transcriptional regulator
MVEERLDPLTEEIAALINELTNRWAAYLNARVRELDVGLTGMQATALWMLRDPLPMRDFANSMSCDPASATGIADRLESKGLLRREPDPEDRRGRIAMLTPEGRKVRRRIERRVAEARPSLMGLSERDKRALRDLLKKAMQGV